jgi:hypothetical protein
MNNNKILQQFHAMFGIFMVMFYLGVGIFLLFYAKMFNIDKALRGIIGTTFLLYGVYRIFVTYKQIKEAFFNKDKDQE